MRPITAALFASLLLLGCVGPTPYQRLIDGRGYNEEQLDDHRFRVTFVGNLRTPSEAADNYVLFRAAELTLETHNDYFILLDQGSQKLASIKSTTFERPVQSYEGADGAQNPVYETVATGSIRPVVSHQAEAVIEVHAGAKPQDELNAFDARELKSRLEPLIMYPRRSRL